MCGQRTNMDLDNITVQIAPEKKGLFLKHSEYEITSKKHKCTVFRRYNDFVTLQNLLVTRSPYRMIPRLPPKQLMLDSLLEERRRGLQRWLRIVYKHPILGNDPIFVSFITDTSAEHQDNLREKFTKELDEYARLGEDVELPLEDQGRLAASREMMRTMLNAITKMKRLADQQSFRMQGQAKDVDEMSGILRLMGTTHNMFGEGTFTTMANGFKEVANLSEKCAQHQHNSINERFNLLIDVLTAHSDLCDRVEKGIVSDHQKALSKMLNLNKQRMKGVIRGSAAENVVAIHEKEVVQNGVVGTLGRRSAFSLHCVLQETALAQESLRSLPSILLSFTYEQNQGNSQISKVWNSIISKEADTLN